MFFNIAWFLHIIVDNFLLCWYKGYYDCTQKLPFFVYNLWFFGKNVDMCTYEKSQCKQMIVFACIVICVDEGVVRELLPLLISFRG